MTYPVLATGRPAATVTRPRRFTAPVAVPAEHRLAEARRLTYQLPLGTAPRPLLGRQRLRYGEAAAQLERALWEVARSARVPLVVDEPATALARRLARTRAVVPPAAAAVDALVPVLAAGAAGELADSSLEPAAAKVAERLIGYLGSRS